MRSAAQLPRAMESAINRMARGFWLAQSQGQSRSVAVDAEMRPKIDTRLRQSRGRGASVGEFSEGKIVLCGINTAPAIAATPNAEIAAVALDARLSGPVFPQVSFALWFGCYPKHSTAKRLSAPGEFAGLLPVNLWTLVENTSSGGLRCTFVGLQRVAYWAWVR
jgi:hypothetical protein